MKHALPVLAALAICIGCGEDKPKPADGKPPAKDGKATDTPRTAYRYDEWESWNAFGKGSMVEFEMEGGGPKYTIIKTVGDKSVDVIKLKNVVKIKVGDDVIDTPSDEPVKRPDPKAECPLCDKPMAEHKDQGKWSEERVEVGGREMNCHRYEAAAKDCRGDPVAKSITWYSPEVPGHIVKMETAETKSMVLKFEKR